MDPLAFRLLAALAALLPLVAGWPAAAQEDDDDWTPRQGFYVQLDLPHYSIEKFDSGEPNVDDAFGVGARAGYRVHPRIAVEAQVDWSGDFEFLNGRELDMKVITANARLYPKPEGRFQPFVSAGIGLARSVTETNKRQRADHGFVARGAAGFDFYLTRVLGISADVGYVLPTGSVSGRDYISLGWGLFIVY